LKTGLKEQTELRNELIRLRRKVSDLENTVTALKESAHDTQPDDRLRLQLEQQLRQSQKMEAVGHLAGGIAHDFNNLLTTISGYSELILDQVKDNEQLKADVGEIMRAVDRASALTGRLLAFGRNQVSTARTVDIGRCAENTYKMIKSLIGEDIDLRLEIPDERFTVRIDPSQVDQIIVNLALNARDAMELGGTLEISAGGTVLDQSAVEAQDGVEPGPFVWLRVKDTGHGMDQDSVDRIFEPFFTTKDYGKGTGLGMPIVHGVVKQYRGLIEVRSTPGAGTAVTVFLPRAESPAEEPDTKPGPESGRGTGTILVVEDEDAVRNLTCKMLADRGFTVLTADTVEDAMRISSEHDGDIDLLLTDVVLPGCNGPELFSRIRRHRPSIKVLFMSGYAADVVTRHGVTVENTSFVAKPFSADTLVSTVHKALEPRRDS
jgi:signal transduction histidine kinase/ActR/RegA family two-component response regulator